MVKYDETLDPTGEGADAMYHAQRDREHEAEMVEGDLAKRIGRERAAAGRAESEADHSAAKRLCPGNPCEEE